jgi:hypothetical protein
MIDMSAPTYDVFNFTYPVRAAKPLSGISPTYDIIAIPPPERRVEELWNLHRDQDLIGKALILGGVNIGIIAEVNRFLNKLVFLDASNLPKSIGATEPRFKDLIVHHSEV